MTALKRLPLILALVTLLAAPGLAYEPPQAHDAGTPHALTGKALVKTVGKTDFKLTLHGITAHHRDMTDKHNEVLGFTGSHILMLEVLDHDTGQAIPKLALTARLLDPAKKAVGEAVTLKWFAPPGHAPYYGAGLNLIAKGDYTVTVSYKQGDKPVTATFTVPIH